MQNRPRSNRWELSKIVAKSFVVVALVEAHVGTCKGAFAKDHLTQLTAEEKKGVPPSASSISAENNPSKQSSFYTLSANSIDGKRVDFSTYQGKVILAVNVASRCGYTPQYTGLEKLYEKFKDRDFLILGFPSNDFGRQEPGSDPEIKKFCQLKYQVKFPIFSKSRVTGEEKNPVYQFLISNTPVDQNGEVKWNFEKFLINRKGQVVGRFRSGVKPESEELVRAIENELKSH